MLTVKYIDPTGPERVFAVKEIEFVETDYTCMPKSQLGFSPSKGRLRFIYPDGSDYHVYGGTIFAMNDNGKTIAKYELGGERLMGETTDVGKIYTGATCVGQIQNAKSIGGI